MVGRVGSGKSSLVQALLGEMEKEGGTVRVSAAQRHRMLAHGQERRPVFKHQRRQPGQIAPFGILRSHAAASGQR